MITPSTTISITVAITQTFTVQAYELIKSFELTPDMLEEFEFSETADFEEIMSLDEFYTD